MRFPRGIQILAFVLIGFCFSIPAPALGQSAAPEASEVAAEPINISADSLMADDVRKFAEFIGNVKAVQGTTEITAERMKIYYQGNPDPGVAAVKEGEAGGIQKIVATGNVTILFDDMTAKGQEAVYTMADRLLVLTGPGATVTKTDSGTMSGAKNYVYRETGRIQFEGDVKGVFYPKDKGLN